MQFLVGEKDFNEQRVRSAIERIAKAKVCAQLSLRVLIGRVVRCKAVRACAAPPA